MADEQPARIDAYLVAGGKYHDIDYARAEHRVVITDQPAGMGRDDQARFVGDVQVSELSASVPMRAEGPAAEAHLLAYRWPGNVRELRNWIEHATVVCSGEVVEVGCFPEPLELAPGGGASGQPRVELDDDETAVPGSSESLESLADVEHRHVIRVLEAVGGNKSRAARILGIDRKTLLARLSRYARKHDD